MLETRKTLVINKLIDTKHKFIHIDPSVYLCVCVCVSLSVCLSVCLSLLVEVHVKSYSLFSFDERLADDKLQSFRHLGGRKLDATFREVPKLSVNELLLKHLTTISNWGLMTSIVWNFLNPSSMSWSYSQTPPRSWSLLQIFSFSAAFSRWRRSCSARWRIRFSRRFAAICCCRSYIKELDFMVD